VPSQGPSTILSVKVALRPVEQLSSSLVTSPVTVTSIAKSHSESENISISAGAVKVGAILSVTVIVCV